MVCSCKDSEDVVALRQWAAEHLGSSPNLFTAAVMTLWWNYETEVKSIVADMWLAIEVETHDGSLRIRVECDQLEDGIVAILRYLHERFGNGAAEVDYSR